MHPVQLYTMTADTFAELIGTASGESYDKMTKIAIEYLEVSRNQEKQFIGLTYYVKNRHTDKVKSITLHQIEGKELFYAQYKAESANRIGDRVKIETQDQFMATLGKIANMILNQAEFILLTPAEGKQTSLNRWMSDQQYKKYRWIPFLPLAHDPFHHQHLCHAF